MPHRYARGVRALLLIVTTLIIPTVNAAVPNKQELQKQLHDAEQRWKKANVHSYSYTAERRCKMCDRAVRVEVKNGSCVKATIMTEPVKETSCSGYTVPEVFERLRTLINDDISTTSLVITFDEKLGYPSRFQLLTIVPHEKEQDDIVEFKKLD